MAAQAACLGEINGCTNKTFLLGPVREINGFTNKTFLLGSVREIMHDGTNNIPTCLEPMREIMHGCISKTFLHAWDQ